MPHKSKRPASTLQLVVFPSLGGVSQCSQWYEVGVWMFCYPIVLVVFHRIGSALCNCLTTESSTAMFLRFILIHEFSNAAPAASIIVLFQLSAIEFFSRWCSIVVIFVVVFRFGTFAPGWTVIRVHCRCDTVSLWSVYAFVCP